MEEPNISQRQAIGKLMQTLTNTNKSAWGEYFYNIFQDWNPIYNSTLSEHQCMDILKNIPAEAKRSIMHRVFLGWNVHHDLQTQKDTIVQLISLKACGPTEFFVLQYLCNFIECFMSTCQMPNDIKVLYNVYTPQKYTIRFIFNRIDGGIKKDNFFSDNNGKSWLNQLIDGTGHNMYSEDWLSMNFSDIVIDMNKPKESPSFVIVPFYKLIEKKINIMDGGFLNENKADLLFGSLIKNMFAVFQIGNIQYDHIFGYSQHRDGVIIGFNNLLYLDER